MNQCMCRVFGILLVVVIYTAFTVDGVGFGVDCSSEPCDDPNTACDVSGCLCAVNYYRKSDNSACASIVTTLTGVCDIADTATEQCSKANTECTADGGGGKCLCKATHYSDTTDCQTRKKPAEGCALGQCVTDATCKTVDGSLKCECDTGFTAKPTDNPTMCNGVVKFATLSYMYVVPIVVSMMFLLR